MRALLLLLLLALPAHGQSQGQVCTLSWRPLAGGQFALFDCNSRQLGNYDPARGVYRPFLPATRTFGEPVMPPIPPPQPQAPAASSAPAEASDAMPGYATDGIPTDRLAPPGRQRIWAGDRVVTEGPGDGQPSRDLPPDRTAQKYVTIVLKDAGQAKALTVELERLGLAARCQLNVLVAGDRRLTEHKLADDQRFAQSGQVAIVQDPPGPDRKGRAIAGIYGWQSAEDLARRLDLVLQPAGRAADPKFNPNAVPGDGLAGGGLDLAVILGLLALGAYGLSLPGPPRAE